MRTIPQIRDRLHQLAGLLSCPELAQLAEETKRRTPVRRARNRDRGHSELNRVAVRNYVNACPDMTYAQIASVFSTNSGRISEIMAGFRDGD